MAVRIVFPVLAAAVSVTLPVPRTTLIQADSFDTVHPHPAVAVTVTEVVPPEAAIDAVAGEIVPLHAGAGAAACVTVTVCPAIVTVALRLAVSVFAAAVSVTVPLPVPLAGLAESQEEAEVVPEEAEVVLEEARVVLEIVQLQPFAVATFSETLPPLAGIEATVGATA